MDSPIIPRRHVDRTLFVRLVIFFAIAVVMTSLVFHDVLASELPLWVALVGFLGGLAIGYILSHMFKVTWNRRKKKAVMTLDVAGVSALLLYFALRFGENAVLGEWFSGEALSTVSLAVFAGALLGRFLGLHISVEKLVEENV